MRAESSPRLQAFRAFKGSYIFRCCQQAESFQYKGLEAAPLGKSPTGRCPLRYTCRSHVLGPHPLHSRPPRHTVHRISAPRAFPAFCDPSPSHTTAALRQAARRAPAHCLAPAVAPAEMSLRDRLSLEWPAALPLSNAGFASCPAGPHPGTSSLPPSSCPCSSFPGLPSHTSRLTLPFGLYRLWL